MAPKAPAEAPPGSGWGPGLLVTATGVGAGDLIAAAVAGKAFGVSVLWVVVVGAFFKFLLNEGIARWHLATGSSVIGGWAQFLPRWISWYFGGYLLIWGFLVAAALGSSAGLAFKSLWPGAPGGVGVWAVIHALLGWAIVTWGRFDLFEKAMRVLIAIMFTVVLICGWQLMPAASEGFKGLLWPTVPPNGLWLLLGLMGGVGGSATMLCYGYWMRERGWRGIAVLRGARKDLAAAYALTAVFGLAMIVIAAGAQPEDASGTALVLALSDRLGELLGAWGRGIFLVGFWCAVASSLIGVWQGVPYLFADWWKQGVRRNRAETELKTEPTYRWFLAFLAVPPLIMQLMDRPLFIVVLYAVAGAFFMPLLAGTLLALNNRTRELGELRNRTWVNVGLVLSLLLFGVLFGLEVIKRLGG